MKICKKCNLEYEDKFAFCHHCGGKLQEKIEQNFCPYCGNKIETSGEFCPYCGKSLLDACPVTKANANSTSNVITEEPIVLQKQEDKSILPEDKLKTSYVNLSPFQNNGYTTDCTDNNAAGINTNIDSNSSNTDKPEESNIGSILKSVLSIIGFILLMAFSKACGRSLARGNSAQQTGFFIGVVLAGIVGGIIPAFVAYKYCKFDNPTTTAWIIIIVHIILSYLSANLIIPIGSIPIGIILAILLYLFYKK